MDVKICTKCMAEKPVTSFTLRKDSKDGLSHWCKVCKAAYDSIRQPKYQKTATKNYLKWQKNNPEKANKRTRQWKKNNVGKINALNAKRHASKLQRTPAWADLEAIKQFYINCPPGMTVDHIVPLQGKHVSGLHVEYNLQYLTRSDNAKKSNKFEGIK